MSPIHGSTDHLGVRQDFTIGEKIKLGFGAIKDKLFPSKGGTCGGNRYQGQAL